MLLHEIIFLRVELDASVENERHIIASVSINRKLMACEIVIEPNGYIIKLIDAWYHVGESRITIATDWRYTDCDTSQSGPKIDAYWQKQKNNFLIGAAPQSLSDNTIDCELYPMLRTPLVLVIGNDGCGGKYYGKKEIRNLELDIIGLGEQIEELKSKISKGEVGNEMLAIFMISLVNRFCSHFEISKNIANEV